jgi:hypothetical protein
MIRDALDGEAQQDARRAVADFEGAVPDVKNARDVLDHFDAYAQGIGDLSHPGVKRSKRVRSEAAAREFDPFYEDGGPDRYVIHLGALEIEVADRIGVPPVEFNKRCMPSGVRSPACSAIVHEFFRSAPDNKPNTYNLARRRESAWAKRPANASSNPARQRDRRSSATVHDAATASSSRSNTP